MVYDNAKHIVSAIVSDRYMVIIIAVVVELVVVAVVVASFYQGLVSI